MGPNDDEMEDDEDDEEDEDDDDDDDDEEEETFGLRGIGSSASVGFSANAPIASAVSCADDNAANVDMAC